MTLEDWQHGAPPRSIAKRLEPSSASAGMVGAHHVTYMAAVGALLDGWTAAHPQTAGLPAIPFDKLANIAARTWSAAHDISPEGDLCPIPYTEVRGVHGPGQALVQHKERPLRYLIQVLHGLQEILPERVLIEVRASYRDEQGQLVVNHASTSLHVAAPRRDRDQLLAVLGATGGNLIEALATPLARLDEDSIRALGTHRDAPTLRGALDYHWARLRNRRVLVVDALRRNQSAQRRHLRDMQISCDELRRKAVDNEERYSRARTAVLDDLSNRSLARSSFDEIHKDASAVWCPEGLGDARLRIPLARAVAGVLGLLADSSSGSITDRDQELYEQFLADLPSGRLPGQLVDLQASGSVTPEVLDGLEQLAEQAGI